MDDRELQAQLNPNNKKRPTLVVSTPVCFEGLMLRILDTTPPVTEFSFEDRKKQIGDQKSALASLLQGSELGQYLEDNLDLGRLEESRKSIEELDLLISAIQ